MWIFNYVISDVNECMGENGGCEQLCIDLPGTYRCSCVDGYLLTENKVNCTGIHSSIKLTFHPLPISPLMEVLATYFFSCTAAVSIVMAPSVTGVYSSDNDLNYLFKHFITSPHSFNTAISTVAVASIGSYISSEISMPMSGTPLPTFTLSAITSTTTTTHATGAPIQTQSKGNIFQHSSILLPVNLTATMLGATVPIQTEGNVFQHSSISLPVSLTMTATMGELVPIQTQSEGSSISLPVSSTSYTTAKIHQHTSAVSLKTSFSSSMHNYGVNPMHVDLSYTCHIFTTETAKAVVPTQPIGSEGHEMTVSEPVSSHSISLLISSTDHVKLSTVDEIHRHSSVSVKTRHGRLSSGIQNTGATQ